MTEPIVSVSDLSLEYLLHRDRPSTLKESVLHRRSRQRADRFRALASVGFEVGAGEFFAVVGSNGAGKSTLMKVLARVLMPTEGRVVVRGRTAPLIELGAGFVPDMTGAENVLLYGSLLGRSPQHMRARLSAIIEWAELEEFMHVPLRAYSSGMVARLAFSIAVDVEPDLLLVDEALSVGDEAFQDKCKERISALVGAGSAIVLVTHDLDQVCEIAARAMWLDHGVCRAIGAPLDVVQQYRQAVSSSA